MFKEKEIQLGTLNPGKKVTIKFESEEPITDLVEINSSCGCSKPYLTIDKQTVMVDYTPTDVPHQLILEGKNSYEAVKTITVKYNKDGVLNTEFLSFKAIVQK